MMARAPPVTAPARAGGRGARQRLRPRRCVAHAQGGLAARAASAAAGAAAAAVLTAAPAHAAALSLDELRDIVEEDFVERRYLVTGDASARAYDPQAHFADSNNDFGDGFQSWCDGVRRLFVSERCKLALTAPVVVNREARTIIFEGWRQVDVFRLPGAPHTPVFTGRTVLTVGDDGRVIDHTEVWDQSPSEIVKQLKFFDPDFDPAGFSA